MRIRQRARIASKRRWRPSLGDIVRKTFRKYRPRIIANIFSNNAFFRRLMAPD